MSIITKTCWINTEIIITKRMGKKSNRFSRGHTEIPEKRVQSDLEGLRSKNQASVGGTLSNSEKRTFQFRSGKA